MHRISIADRLSCWLLNPRRFTASYKASASTTTAGVPADWAVELALGSRSGLTLVAIMVRRKISASIAAEQACVLQPQAMIDTHVSA